VQYNTGYFLIYKSFFIEYNNTMKISDNGETTITLDECQKTQVTLNRLRELFDWKASYYLDPDAQQVFDVQTYHTTHSWDECTFVRDATEDDYMFARLTSRLLSKR
jgi:hypothetical protein